MCDKNKADSSNLTSFGLGIKFFCQLGEFFVFFPPNKAQTWTSIVLTPSTAILLFIASDLASITSHIHNWMLFLLHGCRATQDGRVMVERSDRMWSTGEGNGKPLQYSCLENPMNSMKRQNDRILKEELPRS